MIYDATALYRARQKEPVKFTLEMVVKMFQRTTNLHSYDISPGKTHDNNEPKMSFLLIYLYPINASCSIVIIHSILLSVMSYRCNAFGSFRRKVKFTIDFF